jgi:hypothetical protein
MLALQRTGDRFEARLLPATARLNVPECFSAAHDAGVLPSPGAGRALSPEHEGRVAVASPGDSDRSAWGIVFDEAVLSKGAGSMRLRTPATHQADDAVVGVHEGRG